MSGRRREAGGWQRRATPALLALLLAGTPAAAAGLPDLEISPRPGAALPTGIELTDEAGAPARLEALLGSRPAILVLEYLSCPNLCGVVLGDLAAAIDGQTLRAGRDFDVIAVSVDPRDTPEAARAAKARLGVGAGWHFLTGDGARRVAASVGFPYRWDEELGQFAHPAGAVALTTSGRVARYLFGAGYRPGEVTAALTQAAAGDVAGPAAPLHLLCFGYDPRTGRFTVAVENAVRAAGVATLLGLIALVLRARGRRS
jgi:protein SCO1/2